MNHAKVVCPDSALLWKGVINHAQVVRAKGTVLSSSYADTHSGGDDFIRKAASASALLSRGLILSHLSGLLNDRYAIAATRTAVQCYSYQNIYVSNGHILS